MLEEKIEEARLSSGKRRNQIVIGVLAAVFFCALVVVGLSFFNFSSKNNALVVVSEDERTIESDVEEVRGKFKEMLQEYENTQESRLQIVDVEHWNREGFFEINELKKKAMTSFSSGDYPKAVDNLHVLQVRTVEIIEAAEWIFKENLEKAVSFLAEDLYDEAKFHIEKCLMVIPQSVEALEFQQKIEKLSHVLPLLDGAKTARLENDLQKEYDYLHQVLQITQEREKVTERLNILEKLIKNEKFNSSISAGFASIENRRAEEARNHYREAKRIDPERQELSILSGQLLALEKSLRVQRAVEKANQAVRRDNWQEAKKNYSRAAKDDPENKMVIEGLRRADQVLGLQARISHYFKAPYRLAQDDVLSEARKTVAQAENVSKYSFVIKKQAEELSGLILKLNRLIPVAVISDNKTYVSVRGVGKVGSVSQKIIHLKPGNYTFEGTRDGFKSKLVRVLIPYEQNNFSVRIICDEPI